MVNATQKCFGSNRTGRGWSSLLRATAAGLTLSLCGFALSPDAIAQQAKKPAKAAKKEAAPQQPDTAAAQRAYAAGTKSYEAGDMAGCEQQLSVALAGGGLPNPQMARALYLRGSAYRKQGRPAQAISDLTTAVWLKNGLSETDKTKATEERQLAYREAGLGDSAPPIGAAPLDQSTKSASAPAPAVGAQVVNVGQGSSFWSGFSMPTMPSLSSLTGGSSQPAQTAAAPAAAPAPEAAAAPAMAAVAPDASAPAAAAPTTSWEASTQTATIEAPAQPAVATGYAPAPEAAGFQTLSTPAAAPAPTQGSSWNPLAGAGNFFGNMFSSGSSASAQAPAAPAEATGVTTGSTGSTWGAETNVVTAQTSSMVQRGPDAPTSSPAVSDHLPWTTGASSPAAQAQAAPGPIASVGAPGRYKLQVAAVRSREEAERLASTLSGYPAVRDGLVQTEIDEAVIGSMGTFYRVRLGPYANASEPGQLCTTLKPQGFDCLVVTQ